ncbi:MAG: addiction module protein [Fibrobacter sp.]|nr:addiction module protein [Fibrobacter sp.]
MTQEPMNNLDDNDQSAIDARWVVEAESRLDAYNEGKLQAIPIRKVSAEIDLID